MTAIKDTKKRVMAYSRSINTKPTSYLLVGFFMHYDRHQRHEKTGHGIFPQLGNEMGRR